MAMICLIEGYFQLLVLLLVSLPFGHAAISSLSGATTTGAWPSVNPSSSRFRGYEVWSASHSSSSSPVFCPESSVFYVDGFGYATCCHETDAAPTGTGCSMGALCNRNSVYGTAPHNSSSVFHRDCGNDNCVVQTVWGAFPFSGSTAVAFFCTSEIMVPSDIFREVVDSRTSASSTSLPASTASSDDTASTSSSSGRHAKKAWIAGAVIGPVVFVAINVGATIFFIRRKHARSPPPDYHEDEKPGFATDSPVVDWKNPEEFQIAEGELPGDRPSSPQELHAIPLSELPATARVELADTQVHELSHKASNLADNQGSATESSGENLSHSSS